LVEHRSVASKVDTKVSNVRFVVADLLPMRKPPVGSLGHALQRARFTLGLSQKELAKKLGLRRGYTVPRWEGEYQAPSAAVREGLAAILGTAPAPHGTNALRALGMAPSAADAASRGASLSVAMAASISRHADAIDASPKRVREAIREALDIAERHGATVREARLALGDEPAKTK
jgi:ribosome-binding protein aMBF1 (putative translation factor)